MYKVGARLEFWYFEVMWRGTVVKCGKFGIDFKDCQTVLLDPPILLSVSYKHLMNAVVL